MESGLHRLPMAIATHMTNDVRWSALLTVALLLSPSRPRGRDRSARHR